MSIGQMSPTAEARLRQEEDEAHVEDEMRAAGALKERRSLDDIRREIESSGGTVGGLDSSAEDVILYNRYDGVPSRVTTDQLRQRLRVRFDRDHPWAGQLVWTARPPEKPAEQGTLLCPLHPNSEEREYLDSLRFQGVLCRKSNMKTANDRDAHFEKHKRVFRAVEKDKERRQRERQMELMSEQTKALRSMAQSDRGTLLSAPDKAKAKSKD